MEMQVRSLAGLTIVTCLTLLPATQASAWWACPTGFDAQIQTRNGDTQARCFRPEQTHALDECPNATSNGVTVGTGLRINYQGSRDQCVGFIGPQPVVVLDPTCGGAGAGFSLQVLGGTDRCRLAPAEAAPTRNVN